MTEYQSFAVILTAVPVETKSILSFWDPWKEIRITGDRQIYYETGAARKDRIITAQQKVMGMTAATMLAARAIHLFRPRYLVMSGIAAGTGDETAQMYGDVIVPDLIWDYTTGKYVGPDESQIRFGDVGFLPRPVSIETDPEILNVVRNTIGAKDNEYKVHIGHMACGSCVVANSKVVEKQIRPLFPRTAGLDMESYSIYYAAQNSSDPKPAAIVAKSICDFANSQKDDRFQKFAAYNSAGYVHYLLGKLRCGGGGGFIDEAMGRGLSGEQPCSS